MYQTSGAYKSTSARLFAPDDMMYNSTVQNFNQPAIKKRMTEDQYMVKKQMSSSMVDFSVTKK